VRARLAKQTPPMREVVEHYQRAGVLERIDGDRPIDDVADAILATVR
jgi:hypothetical protein